jgi:hypothetical protein
MKFDLGWIDLAGTRAYKSRVAFSVLDNLVFAESPHFHKVGNKFHRLVPTKAANLEST